MDITITIMQDGAEVSRTFMLGSGAQVDWNEKVEDMKDTLNSPIE